MRASRKVLCGAISALLLLPPLHVLSQESINSSGGVQKGTGGTVSCSVGQLVIQTDSSFAGIAHQGIQRPKRAGRNRTKNKEQERFSFTAFPNPTEDNLTLKPESSTAEAYSYCLYDPQGRKVMSERLNGPSTLIEMSGMVPGIYLVQILNEENVQIETLQIQKH